MRNMSNQPGLPRPDPSGESMQPNASRLDGNTWDLNKADVDAGKVVLTSASSRHVVSSFWAGLFDEVYLCTSKTGMQKPDFFRRNGSNLVLD